MTFNGSNLWNVLVRFIRQNSNTCVTTFATADCEPTQLCECLSPRTCKAEAHFRVASLEVG